MSSTSVSSGAKAKPGQNRAQHPVAGEHLQRREDGPRRHFRIELGQFQHGAARQGFGEGALHRNDDVELGHDDEFDIGAPTAAGEQKRFRAGLGGGDEKPAIVAPPRHRQAVGIEFDFRRTQQLAIRRLTDEIDERQVEILRISLVIQPGIHPVAGQQRIAEPHVPALRQIDGLIELRQRDDAPSDQEIAQRAI